MTEDITALIADLRDALEENRAEAIERWGHIEGSHAWEESDYESKLRRAADALEALAAQIAEARGAVVQALNDASDMEPGYGHTSVWVDPNRHYWVQDTASRVTRILSAPASDALNRVRAEALRDAASRIYPGPTANTIIAALRAEADRIERNAS